MGQVAEAALEVNMQTGDQIIFDPYEWRVICIQNGAALIITENMIDQRAYHNEYKDITWAECSLRKYLNGEFYDRFDIADQSRIIPVINQNADNQWYGSNGGEDTKDSIFLLSLEEAICKYFGDSSANLLSPGKNIGLKEKIVTIASEVQRLKGRDGGGGLGHPAASM